MKLEEVRELFDAFERREIDFDDVGDPLYNVFGYLLSFAEEYKKARLRGETADAFIAADLAYQSLLDAIKAE